MRLRLLISLSCLLLLAWQRAGAQLAPADDFFHGGAQLYISNNIPQAKEVVEQGLRLYPGDDKLKKLEALLNQKQQQQQQQQSQQSKSDQQKKQDQQKSQDQQKQDEQKKDQSEQKKDDQQKQQDQQKQSQAEKDKADQQDKKEQGQPVKPGEMTPEEAKHLLDAQKGDEQLLQLKPPEKPRDNSRPVRDW
jgi:hypothetical protein